MDDLGVFGDDLIQRILNNIYSYLITIFDCFTLEVQDLKKKSARTHKVTKYGLRTFGVR